MNIKQNTNYFTKSDLLKTVGIVMAVLGILLVIFGPSYYLFVLGGAMIPVGIILFFVSASGRANDADMESCIADGLESFEPKPEEDRYYAKRIRKHVAVEIAEGYEYEDGLMLKKTKNGTVRSSEYTRAIVYQLTDALYIARRTVSLISDEVRDCATEIPYDSVRSVEITHERKTMSFGKRQFAVKKTCLAITYGEGELLITPIQDDMNAEHLVEKINKSIAEYHKTKEL